MPPLSTWFDKVRKKQLTSRLLGKSFSCSLDKRISRQVLTTFVDSKRKTAMDTQEEPQIYLTKEKLESLLEVSLTHEQYLEVRHAVFELASLIIETA